MPTREYTSGRADELGAGEQTSQEELFLLVCSEKLCAQAGVAVPEGGQDGVAASTGSRDQALGADLEAADDRRRGRRGDAGDVWRTGLPIVPFEDLAAGGMVALVAGQVGRREGRADPRDPG